MSLHVRRSTLRLPDYDYRQAGYYFVTICSDQRRMIFGDVIHGEMRESLLGRAAREAWLELPSRFPGVSLVEDGHVVMPNHVHGVLALDGQTQRPLGRIVGAFKTATTQRARAIQPGLVVWQSDYYEHVIRTEAGLRRVCEYIRLNPEMWSLDQHNPRRDYRAGPDPIETLTSDWGRCRIQR
jgi:REP element-mobilizing transposase RayT